MKKKVSWDTNNSNNINNSNIANILKAQNYKCANNYSNLNYIGPKEYICPQIKYNQGYLEKTYENEYGYLFDFDDNQILCLNCSRIKKNRINLNKDLKVNDPFNYRCNMDIC